MRNLQLLSTRCIEDAVELEGTVLSAVDYDTKMLYTATHTSLVAFNPLDGQVSSSISLVDAGYLNDGEKVVALQHIPDQMAVSLATSRGDLLMWSPEQEIQECGCVENGITAMAWSPDHELLIIATGQGTFIIMTREFDPVMEIPTETAQFGDAEFITVGWGKKETQFHGSEGKDAAKAKAQSASPAFEWDDRQPRITWRGDGLFFAVSFIEASGCRRVKTWSREGELHSTSEDVDGLEQALAWRPSGSVLASSQRLPHRHQIAFFEKNGLRHREFTLPFGVNEVKVREVLWNSESTVLAVWLEELHSEDSGEDFIPKSWVQLYTTGNYHWYMKQSLSFPATAADRVAAVIWDPEHGYAMHIVCGSGKYLQYTWSWATARSSSQGEEDLASVAVIDGASVLVTPCRALVVPPPMSAYSLSLPCPAHAVTFCQNNMAITLSTGNQVALYVFEGDGEVGGSMDSCSVQAGACGGVGFAAQCKLPTCKGVFSLEADSSSHNPLPVYHLTWLSGDTMLYCTSNPMGDATVLHQGVIEWENKSIKTVWSEELTSTIVNIAPIPCQSEDNPTVSAALQASDGTLLRWTAGGGETEPWCILGRQLRFPQMCAQMAVCTMDGQEVVVGLTDRFRLYVNDTEVAGNCTSFVVHSDFLLLTTHAHTCRCINLNTKLAGLATLSDGKEHPFDESVRRVERGSRIVTVVPHDTKLILQMPRGNLESIHPRALVLAAVRQRLDRLDFCAAFGLMRKHRINMNLIYDHNPKVFLANVEKFLQQVSAVNHINLFLTDLQEDDVTQTMYTAAYNRDTPKSSAAITTNSTAKKTKVDTVCSAVRAQLECLPNADRYFLSILTAYVRKSCPELGTALLRIKALKDDPSLSSITAEDALKYLVFLVDVNELYDVALGTYDFDLVLMVADKSNKDPKEYIPFLNNLRRLEENYQQYTIDKHLKRYASALKHIAKCGKECFEECLSLVQDQKLFTEALSLFPVNSQEYKEICVCYGGYLVEKGRHDEAAIMYSLAGESESALSAYERCSNWRMATCMAAKLGHDAAKIEQLARRMAEKLKEQRRISEAACLLELYANDAEEAIVTLIEGAEWDEAMRLMYKHNRLDFIETNLKSCLLEHHEQYTASIEETSAQFHKYRARLEVVREEKERKRIELQEFGDVNRPDSDLFSDTSSATGESVISRGSTADSNRSTVFSKATGSSRKAKRKHEKKKWSLKEGSANEDIALIEALSKLVNQIDELKGDVHKLLHTLVLYHYQREAEALQKLYDAALKSIEAALPEIWDAETLAGQQGKGTESMVFGPDSTANTIAQAMQQSGRSSNDSDSIQEPWLRTAPQLNKTLRWKLHVTDPASER